MRILSALIAYTILPVLAFKDTSPFLLFSNSPSSLSTKQLPQDQLKSRSQVLESAESFLSGCHSDTYYVLILPSISAEKLSNNTPSIKKAFINADPFSRISIREGYGLKTEDSERLARFLEENCDTKRVVGWDLKGSMEQQEPGRSLVMVKNFAGQKIENIDKSIYTNVLSGITKESKYTVILITPHPENINKDYDPIKKAFTNSKPELKRRIIARAHKISDRAETRPLFEKYQFFSQGIFVGLLTTLILLAILSVGIKAISSLEVSYGAFEKELGPATIKKQ